MKIMTLLSGLIGILIFVNAFADDLQLSPEQQEVWAGEENYWRYVDEGKIDEFLALWHDRFVGWPCDSEAPTDLSDLKLYVEDWFSDVAANGQTTTIKPEAVMIDEGFAVTYLSATEWPGPATSGIESSLLYKIVHTWKKADDGWKIIGGMCGPLVRQ